MQKLLLSPRELAEAIGISEQSIYNRHSIGGSLPPSIKLGRLLRFRVEGVHAWLHAQIEPTVQNKSDVVKRKQGRPSKEEQIRKRMNVAE